jgi:hypothetical protein
MAKKTTRKPAAAVDPDRLRRVVASIEDLHRTHFTDLVHRLETEEGMKLDSRREPASCKMHGITATSTAGVRGAVTNWAAAARRALLSGGA